MRYIQYNRDEQKLVGNNSNWKLNKWNILTVLYAKFCS
jgi:hypothetical protein